MVKLDTTGLDALKASNLGEIITRQLAEQVATVIAGRWSAQSAPGEAPAVRTGTLAASIEIRPTGTGYQVGSSVSYAAGLEFGTSQAAARPWLRPAVEQVRAELATHIRVIPSK